MNIIDKSEISLIITFKSELVCTVCLLSSFAEDSKNRRSDFEATGN